MNSKDRLVEVIDSDNEDPASAHDMDFDVPKDELDNIDDDDVPSDFFDDFLNNEFMDGLDVVDAWDDEHEKKEGKLSTRQRKSTSRSRAVRSERSRRQRSRSRSFLRQKYREEYYRRRARSRERHTSRGRRSNERKKDYDTHTKNKSKEPSEIDDGNIDHRRDPEKTKRDIQKDKDKCAKNQEDKFISEKLKVVETGLVPPGMELDVDINTIKPSAEVKEKKTTKPVSPRNAKQKSISPRDSRRKKISTPKFVVPRRNYRYSKSPVRRRSRSPIRFSKSPIRKRRRSSERRYIPDRDIRVGVYSSDRHRELSREISLELNSEARSSERRESWGRNQDKHFSKGSSRSKQSSSRPRGVDFLEELAKKLAKSEKKKYYKKVQQIMSQTPKHVSSYQPMVPIPPPTPVPAPMTMPVMGPGSYYPHVDPSPQYDHHFFIGQQFTPHPMHYQSSTFVDPSVNTVVANNTIPEASVIPPAPIQSNINACSPAINSVIDSNISSANNISIEIQKEKEAINKLFEDKKISLSDFLSMSAKHTDPTEPTNVQKKIKVISLCQDAVKVLGGDLQLCGRFFLKKIRRENEKPVEGKFCSPLRKIPVVRFSFTTLSRNGDEKVSLQSTLGKLMASLGLSETLPPVAPKPFSKSPAPELGHPADLEMYFHRGDSVSQLSAKKAKMCQTDPFKCQVCEVRKSRTFANVEVQCDIESVDTGTQVTNEDLMRMGLKVSPKDNLKNQSLTHLTPAQLMRQTLGQDDHIQSPGYSQPKLSSDISSEKQNYRPNLKGNDHFNRPNLSGNDNYARALFGFDKRPEFTDRFSFSNFGNSSRPVNSQFELRPEMSSRPLHFDGPDRNRNSNPNTDNTMGGNDHFESGRNYANNPNPLMKRGLLPNPPTSRKY